LIPLSRRITQVLQTGQVVEVGSLPEADVVDVLLARGHHRDSVTDLLQHPRAPRRELGLVEWSVLRRCRERRQNQKEHREEVERC
jgi:hypothetical protein